MASRDLPSEFIAAALAIVIVWLIVFQPLVQANNWWGSIIALVVVLIVGGLTLMILSKESGLPLIDRWFGFDKTKMNLLFSPKSNPLQSFYSRLRSVCAEERLD